MALSRIQYEADGSTDTFSLTFPYISKDDIKVSLDGDSTTAFTWPSSSSIKLDTTPESGTIVDIKRETERNNILVDFQDGSTLLESDLDLAARQSFYLAQESFDQTGSTLAVAEDGSYSASSRRISSMGYPSASDDASTKSYVDDIFAQGEDAYAMATEAEHWANYPVDSLVPEGDQSDDYSALHHATKAGSSASSASSDASDAATSASNAATSESNAADSADAAAASETNAQSSEDAADSHATESQNWANAAEDTLVPEGDQVDDYSALHWARKAEGWAQGVNMPSATGNGGKLIRQAADESGFEYITASEGRTLLDVYSTTSLYTKTESDNRYAQLSGDVDADFSSMPLVGGSPVVESGSNSNGEWMRWADGTQICKQMNNGTVADSPSAGDYSWTWTYPQPFSEFFNFPSPNFRTQALGDISKCGPIGTISDDGLDTDYVRWRVNIHTDFSYDLRAEGGMAVGFWK